VPAKPKFDDDEKTTIESQWEDEASTTVEQAEAAEKIRALGVGAAPPSSSFGGSTNVTSPSGSVVEEPTVDDQHAPAQLAALQALTQTSGARLVITQGNETGNVLEMKPGKSYTIGRGIDNDIVLTDIAVSRKHFDLKHEDGAWIIVDRGSGNGTLVNNNIEDNPFMLANGDVIEIGNTSFRFEQENGAVRRAASFEVEVDDEEMSTVVGKSMRNPDSNVGTPPEQPIPLASPFARPKTLPPPAQLRSKNPSSAPPTPPSFSVPPVPPLQPPPMPQMLANRSPVLPPQSPTMLANEQLPPHMLKTTMPGQQPPVRPLYYPQASEMSPQAVGVHAQMLVLSQQPNRGDGSTQHVPPTPYAGVIVPQARFPLPSQLSRRAKLMVGGAALTVLAAIVTAGIIKATGSDGATAAGAGSGKTPAASAGSGLRVEPIKPPPKTEPAKIEPPKPETVATPKTEPPKTEPPKTEPPKTEPPKTEPPKIEPPKTIAKVEPPKVEPPKTEPPKTIAKVDPPKVEPPKVEPPKTIAKVEPPKVEPPKADPPKTIAKADPPKVEKTVPPKADPPKVDPPKADPPKTIVKADPPKVEKTVPPKTNKRDRTAPPKRVAAAVDTTDVKNKADGLYRNKRFGDAASVLIAASKSLPDEDAKQLRYVASAYDKLGRAFSAASAPGTKAVDAYERWVQADNFDSVVGGAFSSEIKAKIATTAPKAAINYMAAKNFEAAHVAVGKAESAGASDGNVKLVRQSLENQAGTLYGQAKSEMASSPDSAKDKLRRVQHMVDSKSPWWKKAQMLLSQS
jgi:pSer/pThr/pTyr-binding forkhead associated (FHA) protein